MEGERLHVAVIGAGAGGLAICRHFLDESKFTVTVFEQTGTIGGTWVYTDFIGTEPNGFPLHSSMYKNLETNLPKEAMAFLDFPFPEEENSFISHSKVLGYLESYCHHFKILPCIKFNTAVVKITPIEHSLETLTWKVVFQNVISGDTQTSLFDVIAVCNGHFSIPRYPDISGMELFSGSFLHSHSYRSPEPCSGKIVALLGAGPSGVDIALEVAIHASEVYLCHKFKMPVPMGESKVKQMPWPTCYDARGIHFENGTYSKVDVIIVCTGYEYTFPFLDLACGVKVIENRVVPLYKHFLHTKYPSMAIIGVPFGVLPFPLMDVQAQVFRKIVDGTLKLPSEREMNADTESELKTFLNTGKALRHFHKMGYRRFEELLTDLTNLANIEPCNPAIHKLFEHVYFSRINDLAKYRSINYGIARGEFYVKAPVQMTISKAFRLQKD